jgi:hypothetical protein
MALTDVWWVSLRGRFKDDPEVNAMWRLRTAYGDKNFDEFQRIVGDPRNKISSDPFIVQ